MQYKTTDFYSPVYDHGIAWDDPALMITWPVTLETAIVSERDRTLPRLCEQTQLFDYSEPSAHQRHQWRSGVKEAS